jgi:hypothetical protein
MDTTPFEKLIGAIYEDDFEQTAQILATHLSSMSLAQRTKALVKILINAGANPNIETYDNDTANKIAERVGNQKILLDVQVF